jgi:hypothetical protein
VWGVSTCFFKSSDRTRPNARTIDDGRRPNDWRFDSDTAAAKHFLVDRNASAGATRDAWRAGIQLAAITAATSKALVQIQPPSST